MFSIEFKQSRGCITETYYARDVIDMYILYKDGQKIFSEREGWEDYYFIVNIDNYYGEIQILKRASCYDCITDDYYRGCYATRRIDYASTERDLYDYLVEISEMLDIQNYKIKML